MDHAARVLDRQRAEACPLLLHRIAAGNAGPPRVGWRRARWHRARRGRRWHGVPAGRNGGRHASRLVRKSHVSLIETHPAHQTLATLFGAEMVFAAAEL